MTVSIIVPVYNVADCMRRGIDSILSQSFQDFELILVDDGSTDDSGVICDEYASKDDRIQVIHKENGGISSARNAGLELAKGEWAYFPDPDDELYPDCLSTLASGISEDVDVVMGGYEVLRLNGTVRHPKAVSSEPVILDRSQSLRVLFAPYSYSFGYVGHAWLRFFRMSVIKTHHLRFDTSIAIREATLFDTLFLCSSRGTTCFFPRPIYRYCMRETSEVMSATKSFSRKYLTSFDANMMMVGMIENVRPRDPEIVKCAKEEVMDRYRRIKRMLASSGVRDDKLLRGLRMRCIKGLGIPFVAGYLYKWARKKLKKRLLGR